MIEQAEAFVEHIRMETLPCKILMHDNHGKYSKPFLASFKKARIKTRRTAMGSPDTVAFLERFVQSIKQDVLDHFIVFGHKHRDVLCSHFKDHYHTERPHQGQDNKLLQQPRTKKQGKQLAVPDTIRLTDIRCYERLGGLLKSYSRKAAQHKSS